MAAWKQILVTTAILVAAAVAWARLYPGAPEILAGWGLDWAQAAQPQAAGAGTGGGNARRGQAPVVTRAVGTGTINDSLQAIGTGRANASVTVTPFTSGRLTEIAVAPGSRVEAGQAIARLDSDAESITLDRARVAVEDAQAKLDRVKSLRASNAATPVAVADAEVTLSNAKLAEREAQLALDRRSIVSPIAGIVGILPVEAGNYVTAQTAIATVSDRSSIVVDFWVPERFASQIEIGSPLTATPVSNPGQQLKGTVSAVDNRIDETSRTLQVQARIPNDRDALRAGMSFQVAMKFSGQTYPSVDALAVQWANDGSYVWAVRDGKALRMPVRIIQRNTDSVLVEAELTATDQVVTEGVYSVRDGADVMVAGDNPQSPLVQTTAPKPAGS